MKSPADLLFKLRHAVESATFAVLEPDEARALLAQIERLEQAANDSRARASAELAAHGAGDWKERGR